MFPAGLVPTIPPPRLRPHGDLPRLCFKELAGPLHWLAPQAKPRNWKGFTHSPLTGCLRAKTASHLHTHTHTYEHTHTHTQAHKPKEGGILGPAIFRVAKRNLARSWLRGCPCGSLMCWVLKQHIISHFARGVNSVIVPDPLCITQLGILKLLERKFKTFPGSSLLIPFTYPYRELCHLRSPCNLHMMNASVVSTTPKPQQRFVPWDIQLLYRPVKSRLPLGAGGSWPWNAPKRSLARRSLARRSQGFWP